jgi:hypothetical protein
MLTRDDVIDVLTAIAAADRRTVGEADVDLWSAALNAAGVASRADAIQAVVGHFAESSEWLMPAHVVRGVKAIRKARVAAAEEADGLVPNVDPDDAPAFVAERRAILASAADGTLNAEAYAAGGWTLTGVPPRRPVGDLTRATPEIAGRVKAIAATTRVPRADLTDGGERPKVQRPPETVPPDAAAAMEAERDRQLAALERLAEEAS